MNVKIFKVRIDRQYLQNDQMELDAFLSRQEVLHHECAFVSDEQFWSVILFYVPNQNFFQESKVEDYKDAIFEMSPRELSILHALKIWRSEKAKNQNVPSYCIATNKELEIVARKKPLRKEELAEIKGFGKHKIENYGMEILEILEAT